MTGLLYDRQSSTACKTLIEGNILQQGADAREIAAGFQASNLQRTLTLVEALMADDDLLIREAAREIPLAIHCLYEAAQKGLARQ